VSNEGAEEYYRSDGIPPGIFLGNNSHKNNDIQFQMVCASKPLMVKKVGLTPQPNPEKEGTIGQVNY
jgi:hypothetical protein